MAYISRQKNIVSIAGRYDDRSLHNLLATIHNTIIKRGFEDIVLDFRGCVSSSPSSMLAICAQVLAYRQRGFNFELLLPENKTVSRLFRNANWANLIDSKNHETSNFRGYTQVPAIQYNDPFEQHEAVNGIVNAILGAVPEMARSSMAAFEWSINEITDNVLIHSESLVGGLVQVTTFHKQEKIVQYVVADPGITIPGSLRSIHSKRFSDTEILDKAIREGVTRDKKLGQGNGLYGSFQICSKSKGRFRVESGHARLIYSEREGLHIHNESIPYDGTLVVASINFSNPDLLEEALKFGGKKHIPVDYVEVKYENDTGDRTIFNIKKESESFGSRLAGTPVRIKLMNLYSMCKGSKIVIDFEEISLISSSFADEVFGKLFKEIGPLMFMQCFEFRNLRETVRNLIDKAISERIAVSEE